MKKIFKIIIYFIGLWIFSTLAKENIYILIFGIGVILWWGLDQLEKKMKENSMNFLIRIESLESKVQELEVINEYSEKDIEFLKDEIRELNERIYTLEKPFQRSEFDHLD
ncbi:hypothetical protein QDT42_08225 [Acinetobacter baumannii]|uniref:hypothetical protein n=1 Tax=Acinetobacter baumannii TaxID=470 RepID=UPI00244D3B69|nr:hypothetical protein [Acinetobacter baumannii]MDH2620537.1 hypothetical protein [Acinetobacter baumannii]